MLVLMASSEVKRLLNRAKAIKNKRCHARERYPQEFKDIIRTLVVTHGVSNRVVLQQTCVSLASVYRWSRTSQKSESPLQMSKKIQFRKVAVVDTGVNAEVRAIGGVRKCLGYLAVFQVLIFVALVFLHLAFLHK